MNRRSAAAELLGRPIRETNRPEHEDCETCGTPLVFSPDAIGRLRGRCPACEGTAPRRPPHPDEVLVPQSLVRASTALPPIAPGQLRCQRCACGVDGRARFCPECERRRRPAPKSRRTCARKPCARCRQEFLPTGPRALYCDRCRRSAAA